MSNISNLYLSPLSCSQIWSGIQAWNLLSANIIRGCPIQKRLLVDVVICGETREWELVEYVHDEIAAGGKKALIVVSHVVSEQSGMWHCAEWLKPMVPEVPVEFMASKEPFWVAPSLGWGPGPGLRAEVSTM